MAMTTSQFNSLLYTGLRKVFFDQYKEQEQMHREIFDVQKSSKKREDFQDITGIGMFDEKEERGLINYEDMVEGYSKQFTHTAFAKGMRISRELKDDDQYGVMARRTRALARAGTYRIEYNHARLFNNATSTTYHTGGDGKALLSASHTLAASPGTTWSNYSASTDLSQSALETAFNAFRRYTDDTNMLISVEPKILLIPPELEWDAMEIMNSTLKVGTANNDINTMKGRLQIKVWPFITDTNAWFVLAGKGEDLGPYSFERIPMEYENDGDFDTKDLKVSGYCRFSLGFVNPRFCYGSLGST